MSKHIKKFEAEAEFNEWKASEDFVLPYLSWCVEENTFQAESIPSNVITVTAESDSITATAEKAVASTITIVLSGDIDNVITILSGQTIGTLSIETSATVRTCNLSLSSDSDKAYSYVLETSTVTIPAIPQHDYSKDYLTIVSTTDNNTIAWAASSSSLTKTISISTDNGQTWTNKTSTTRVTILTALNTGDKLLIKGNNATYATSSYYNYFMSSGQFNIEGNIMSLIYGDNFIGQTTLSGTYTFSRLFSSTKIVNASNLILPATTLAQGCYRSMFTRCTSLTAAPALPATTLATSCYQDMFYVCTSLTTAPELPATTLASNCYDNMFQDCTSLTAAPALPATTLADNCYHYMFYGCTSLTTATALPATTLVTSCYQGMFMGCASLTAAPALPATTLASSCYWYMFANCTSLTTAPTLPATTLVDNCYQWMFQDCTSLNYIKCLATDISASNCINEWVTNVAANGTFIKDSSMNDWTVGVSGIPSGWTVEDAS